MSSAVTNFEKAVSENTRLHWNYFLALERDMEAISRYIEFSPANFNTYSIELAHLLLSAASEVDTLAKRICASINPNSKRDNINQYREIIKTAEDSQTKGSLGLKRGQPDLVEEDDRHRLSELRVHVPRYGLEFCPWGSWAKDANPSWWASYNKVKHERSRCFSEANLNNALHALAALLAINYLHYRVEMTKANPHLRLYAICDKAVTRLMEPQSTFLRFGEDFYDNPIETLKSELSGVHWEIERLSEENG